MKPATELPWESHGFMVNAITIDQMICDCVNDKDATYIVHACNAYPKLVEALKDAAIGLHEGGIHNGAELALLRELGEEA